MNLVYLLTGVIVGALIINFIKIRENKRKANDTNELMERIARDMTELILRGKSYDSDKNNVFTIEQARRTRERRKVI